MTRSLRYVAFLVGLVPIVWVGAGYAGSNWPALVITALIGGFYFLGNWELLRFDHDTERMSHALSRLTSPPEHLSEWLEQIPPSLRTSVRSRVEGERVGLPGPALTPYLAGLLVLL